MYIAVSFPSYAPKLCGVQFDPLVQKKHTTSVGTYSSGHAERRSSPWAILVPDK